MSSAYLGTQEFTEQLWQSRAVATSARGAASDLGGILLNFVLNLDENIENKVAGLESTSKRIAKKGLKASQVQASLISLSEKMLATSETIAVETEGKRRVERTELEDLRRKVERLDIDIENQKCRVVLPVINTLRLGYEALRSLLRGSPVVAIEALVETTKYGVRELFRFRDHLDETNRRLRVMESERTELEARVVALESQNSGNGDTFTASDTLKSIASRVKDFSGRLDGLTNVFSELTREQEYLASYLRELPDSPSDQLLASRVELIRQSMPRVINGLDAFINDLFGERAV
ncbi:hypothetical protein BOTBODRAFT_426791 [Botryobasidium botryosum FD-172 SS1]|uniref:Uncharacterized protein n=1 Tax=Botryobasidium botryosum (strain FD-172 SS1) TaxID=930990 RepID=A0A067MBZ4_BOTB1|nr:hypothetical protein BOTBODRAFT_426791 [Botryobasidium botryosum FD-172 SS1]